MRADGDVDGRPSWALDEGFSMLGRSVRIRTTSVGCADLIVRLFGACRSAVPNDAPTFELSERTGAGPAAQLTLDGEILIRNTSPAGAFDLLVWRLMNDAVSDAGDLLVIHAGAVVAPNWGALVMPAGSGSGKTTLTAGLVRAGFAYLSDEMAVFDPPTLRVLPAPRGLSVKEGTFEALGITPPAMPPDAARFLEGAWPLRPEDLPGVVGGPAPLRAVIAPTYRHGTTTRLEPVSRAAGVMDLATNAFNLPAFGGSRGVRLLAEAVRSASCYRLTVGSLGDAVETIARLPELTPGR